MKLTFGEIKALIREAFDDIDARKDARGRPTSALGTVMLKPQRHKYLAKKNHQQQLIDEMEKLFDAWGIGGAAQNSARDRILNEVDNDTALGQLIREHAEMETSVFEEWIDGKTERAQAEFERLKKEILAVNSGGISMYDNFYTKRDLDDGTVTMDEIEEFAYYDQGNPGMLYRSGKLGSRMESWTTNSEGAVINNTTGMTFSGKLHEKHWTDLKREGYSILAGPMRMMGAPGESEVTLIKLDVQ